MGDSWRFDPYKDYTSDDSESGNNFRRFKNRKRKNKFGQRDDNDDYINNSKKKEKHHNKNWR